MSKRIIFTVPKKGPVSMEADGFSGTSCLSATAPFEAALGGTTSDRVEKPEMLLQSADQITN
jgi:hypothetical protein